MLGELGTSSLTVGVLCATLTALLWLRVALFGTPARAARLATAATLGTAVVACGVLEAALLRHDFSVGFVAENGGRRVPLYYTVTSLWSALDGSLLLWLLVLGGYAALLAGRRRPDRLRAYAMVVVSAVTVFFFALSRFAADPFRTVDPVPADGPGPNPLLQQHPAMGVHPPAALRSATSAWSCRSPSRSPRRWPDRRDAAGCGRPGPGPWPPGQR